MHRGDIYLVQLDPALGSEANKTRPALIVSNNAANSSADRRGRGVITVVPITSNLRSILPFQVLLPSGQTGLAVDSKAQAEQVRSISTDRLVRKVGAVDGDKLQQVDDALRLHLSL